MVCEAVYSNVAICEPNARLKRVLPVILPGPPTSQSVRPRAGWTSFTYYQTNNCPTLNTDYDRKNAKATYVRQPTRTSVCRYGTYIDHHNQLNEQADQLLITTRQDYIKNSHIDHSIQTSSKWSRHSHSRTLKSHLQALEPWVSALD